jgi:hypothetical protein
MVPTQRLVAKGVSTSSLLLSVFILKLLVTSTFSSASSYTLSRVKCLGGWRICKFDCKTNFGRHWRSFDLWSSYVVCSRESSETEGCRRAKCRRCFNLPQTRQDRKAVGIVGPRGLGANICVQGPWCLHSVWWQRVWVLVFLRSLLLSAFIINLLIASTSSSASSPTLSCVKDLGDALVVHLRSIGVALGHWHVPGCGPHSGPSLGYTYINIW